MDTQPLSFSLPLFFSFSLFLFPLVSERKETSEIYTYLTIAFRSVLFPLDCGPITATTP